MPQDKHSANRAIIWFAVCLAICVTVTITLALVYIAIIAQAFWLVYLILLSGVAVLFCEITFGPNWLYHHCCHEVEIGEAETTRARGE